MSRDEKIRISAVSYLNTKPFLYGIKRSGHLDNYELFLDNPAECARKLKNDQVDIGLVPIAIIPELNNYRIISEYCIGAVGAVKSVLLLSDVPLNEIGSIYLDYQSNTSVLLTRVLAKYYWKISPDWIQAKSGFEENIKGKKAGVVIGDRTFDLAGKYSYEYDLPSEWLDFTGLPFVFACWIANKPLPEEFLVNFSRAVEYGITHLEPLVEESELTETEKDYLINFIDYPLDEKKKQGLSLFLKLADKIR